VTKAPCITKDDVVKVFYVTQCDDSPGIPGNRHRYSHC